MSGTIGLLTPGRIAVALGTIGVGALVGGAVANSRDANVGSGALIGGASALAGLGLLLGGAHLWRNVTASRAAATAGASTLGTTFGASILRAPKPAPALTAPFTNQVSTTAARLLDEAALASRAALAPIARPVPTIAATPILPFSASGSTFINALGSFMR